MTTFKQLEAMEYSVGAKGIAKAPSLRDTLLAAYDALKDPGQKAMIYALLVQRGCDCHDPQADYLTELCEVIMFG